MDKIARIRELVKLLNEASDAYYNTGNPIMDDAEFDQLLEELKNLETEKNFVMSNSPTHNVGSQSVEKFNKITHEHLMLSLDKAHTVEEILKFVGNNDVLCSIKLDGLSLSATYIDGDLVRLESRGNGINGTDVMIHSSSISNLPKHINVKGKYVIDGECLIPYDIFEKINEAIPNEDDKYANPRNLASGTLSLLNSEESKERGLQFWAWNIIECPMDIREEWMEDNFKTAARLGFDVVPYIVFRPALNSDLKMSIETTLDIIRDMATQKHLPMDGCVWSYDNIDYGKSLGRTDKFFRHSISYKYEDNEATTVLRDIEWSAGKTKLTPVVIFDPVELDGTSVSRASIHNLSMLKGFEFGIGDEITVYKANMIIPQVRDNLTRSNTYKIIDKCPCCGGEVSIEQQYATEELICLNPNCKSKLLMKLSHAVSRNALNIDGLSEATLETLINRGWIKSFKDIYHLSDFKTEMTSISGFGVKSVNKLLNAIEDSRNTTLDRFLYSLSIPLIGRSVSKDIANYCHNSVDEFIFVIENEINKLMTIDGIGIAVVDSLDSWWNENSEMFYELLEELTIEVPEEKKSEVVDSSSDLNGQSFCITGKLIHYSNRDALVADIEAHNGIVCSGVTKKTHYLLTNDTTSGSSKNKKAAELGIPVITEEDFMKMIGKTN